MKLTKLVVPSHNDGKVAEIKALLAPLHIEVQSAKELRLGDGAETGKTTIYKLEQPHQNLQKTLKSKPTR